MEVLQALGNLGLVAISVVALIAMIIFYKPIRDILENFTRVQVEHGETKLSVSQERDEIEEKAEVQTEEQAVGEMPKASSDGKASQPNLEVEPETSDEWLSEMMFAFSANEIERGETAYKRAQESESDAVQKLKNEAFYLYLRYRSRDAYALGKLQAMIERTSATPEALFEIYKFIGSSYELSNDFLKAAAAYESSAENAQTEDNRANSVGSVARCLFAAGEQEQAYGRVTEEIGKLESNKALSALYKSLASLYESSEDTELRAIALEKALEYAPNDTSLRFDTAYSYGQNSFDTLALLHYDTLLKFEPRSSTSLNNIAVAYGELQMEVHKTRFLKKAVEENESLAAANLAYQYIDAGFVEEAMQILNEAKQKENVHPNVGRALANATEKQETELKTEKQAIENALEQRNFLLSFAEAYLIDCAASDGFEGIWYFDDGTEANAVYEVDTLKIQWERNGKEHYLKAYPKNCGAKITEYSRKEKYISTDLADKGYAVLESGKQINIMILKGGRHTFLTLKRSQ